MSTQLLEEMLEDEGFKRFLMQPNTEALDVDVEPDPSIMQLLKIDKSLIDVVEALNSCNREQADTRQLLQELIRDKENLQLLERQALTGLLKELGLSG